MHETYMPYNNLSLLTALGLSLCAYCLWQLLYDAYENASLPTRDVAHADMIHARVDICVEGCRFCGRFKSESV